MSAQDSQPNKPRTYEPPRVLYEATLDALAATCVSNPNAKTAPGKKNAFGRPCSPKQLFS